jgi:predicted nucleic acid-binding protein
VVLALLDDAHVHNHAAEKWFYTPGRQWALCAFVEAGVLRYFSRPETGELTLEQATVLLGQLKQRPGYHYQSITADWHTLIAPFFKRLHGHKQITDAYLLGLALRKKLVLATFDQGIVHLAGEHRDFVRVLETV